MARDGGALLMDGRCLAVTVGRRAALVLFVSDCRSGRFADSETRVYRRRRYVQTRSTS